MSNNRIFCGVFPGGLVYADRQVEVHGDYKRLAFLAYDSLKLEIEKDCPPALAQEITADAATIQAKRGQLFEVTTSGQTVMLGGQTDALEACHSLVNLWNEWASNTDALKEPLRRSVEMRVEEARAAIAKAKPVVMSNQI